MSILQLLVKFRTFSLSGHASFSKPSPRRILVLLNLQPEVLVLVVSEAGL